MTTPTLKCSGWQLAGNGYPIDPCDYREGGSWTDGEKVYYLLVCAVCGFPDVSWKKVGEAIPNDIP